MPRQLYMTAFPYIVFQHLSRTLSDHAQLLVTYKDSLLREPRPFRYQHMWASHPTFKQMVKTCWDQPLYATPLCALVGKLKRLKQELKKWNKEVFGNLFSNISAAEENVLVALQAFDEDPSPSNLQLLNEAKNQLIDVQRS